MHFLKIYGKKLEFLVGMQSSKFAHFVEIDKVVSWDQKVVSIGMLTTAFSRKLED